MPSNPLKILAGGREFTAEAGLGNTLAYVRAGSILVRQDADAPPMEAHTAQLLLDVYPGADGCAELYEDDGRSPRYQHGNYCRTCFELRTADGVITLVGQVAEGAPLGESRSLTLDISLPQAPEEVLLNGGHKLSWEALKTKGRYRVVLPVIPADAPIELRIR